jgi:hypothetical protein
VQLDDETVQNIGGDRASLEGPNDVIAFALPAKWRSLCMHALSQDVE